MTERIRLALIEMRRRGDEAEKFGNSWQDENSISAKKYWDLIRSIQDIQERIEAALPGFYVKYIQEIREYCLVPRRDEAQAEGQEQETGAILRVVR